MSVIRLIKKFGLFATGAGTILLLLWGALPTVSARTSDLRVTAFSSPKAQPNGGFGSPVAVSDTTLIVGASGEGGGAGRAYIFSRTGSLIATLTSPNTALNGEFGFSVAVSGNIIVVGAPYETANGFAQAGHAYIFSSTGSLIATLSSPNAQSGGAFSNSLAVSGNRVVVGALYETANGSRLAGHAYIFSRTGSLIATLSSSSAQPSGYFGASVAVSGTRVLVGGPSESAGGFEKAGHAYVFNRDGSPIATLTSPNPRFYGEFGEAVAVSRANVVVGEAGHAYIFSRMGSLTVTLSSPNPQPYGGFGFGFGWSVAVSGNRVVVGGPDETAGGFVKAGHAYVFSMTGSMIANITSPNPEDMGWFGFSVAVRGATVVVGAQLESAGGFAQAGHAYLFRLPGDHRETIAGGPRAGGCDCRHGLGLAASESQAAAIAWFVFRSDIFRTRPIFPYS